MSRSLLFQSLRRSLPAQAVQPCARRQFTAAVRLSEQKSSSGDRAKTDSQTRIKYPYDDRPSEPVRGKGGKHHKPTLPSLSLEGKVAVVTGGARGLGLVMAQGLMRSGADVALVDLNGIVILDLRDSMMLRGR